MYSYGNHASSLLNLPRDECKRILRRLELEAYCSTVSALRAQGDLTNEKKLLLQNLQDCLKISAERHGAEVRRAVNDQKLTTIANNLSGPDVSSKWMREGRRLVAIMPRLVPHTAFTATADSTAVLQAEKNKTLRDSACTGSFMGGHIQGIQGVSRGNHSIRQANDLLGSLSSHEIVSLSSSYLPADSSRETEEMSARQMKQSRRCYASAGDDSAFESMCVDSSKTDSLVTGNSADLFVNGTVGIGECSREASDLDVVPIKRRKYDSSDVSLSLNSPTVSLTAGGFGANQSSFHGAIRCIQQPTPSSNIPSRPSIKLTMTKPVPRLTYPKPGGAPQKVIIVSGTGVSSATTICAPPQTVFPQKSVVVSVMKTSTSVPLPAVVTSFTMNHPVTPSDGNLTVANSLGGVGLSGSQVVRPLSASFPQVNIVQNPNAVVSNSNSCNAPPAFRPRLKSLASRPRTPQILQASSLNHSGFNVSGAPSGARHLKTVPLKTTIHIGRPDNTKKISVSTANTKILPKPMTLSSTVPGSSAASAAITLTRPSSTSNQCHFTNAKVTAGSLVQGSVGSRVVFSESGSISHNQVVVQNLSSTTTSRIITEKVSEVNTDVTKTRPTLVINRIIRDENVHHEIPVNILQTVPLNSVDAEASQDAVQHCSAVTPQTTVAGYAVRQASYNTTMYQITAPTPAQHPIYALGSAAENPAEMSSVEMQENDTEDLSAISDLLSLKMFPAGIEQISPASPIDDVVETAQDNDADETLSSQEEIPEEVIADRRVNFVPQPPVKAIAEPIYSKVVDHNEGAQVATVDCVSTMSSVDGSVTTNGQDIDTVSSTVSSLLITDSSCVIKQSGEGPLDFRIEPDLHSNCTSVNSHPVIITHLDVNHFNCTQADGTQATDKSSTCYESTEILKLSNYNQLVDSTTSSLSSQDGDHLLLSPNKMNDSMSPIPLGKRKRWPPRSPGEHDQFLSGWCRHALALLARVMKFRSPHNEKGKANAASWFNFPVDAKEVPDYYDIVHRPMDFSTIKCNLKSGAYDDWSGFHSDMLLVRDNCHLYNPADTDVRHDCDLVFEFYQQEYSKTLVLWKQQQLGNLDIDHEWPFDLLTSRR